MRDFQLPGRSPVLALTGICVTSHPIAAQTAVSMLERGGNAVDAAIAAALVLGIAEPAMTGIGGDCFALVKPAGSDEIVALNASGRAPAALDATRLREAGYKAVAVHSADAVSVPGAIDGFCALAERFGSLDLAELLAPAIHHAENGIPVAPRTAFDWETSGGALQGAARDFYLSNGQPLAVGQLFRAPQQAEVLRKVANLGRAGFYEGEVAEDMVASLRALGGTHTLADFAATRASWANPISRNYKGIDLVEHPPNGQGATALLMAGILGHFDLASLDPFGAERAHLEAEAAKLAYDARDRFLSDADHMTRLEHMLDPRTARDLAALVDPARAMGSPRALSEAVHKDTVYLTVVDRNRMMVSLIYSIFHGFGSGIASSKYGILFQNRGAGFTLEEGHPNELKGGKRPMHTIIPAMLSREGKPFAAFGVMGGAYQPNGHVRYLSNIADFGMDPQQAIDGPRSFADATGFAVERGYSDAVRRQLADLGHKVTIPHTPIGGAQAIHVDWESGVLIAGSDPRKDGCAIGY
jgi:gamma-glutamyltranspeptidase/glutathione hydrolase